MIVMPRDQLALQALARYYLLDRRRVQTLVFPKDSDGRVARRRLAALEEEGLIRRHNMLVASVARWPAGPGLPAHHEGLPALGR